MSEIHVLFGGFAFVAKKMGEPFFGKKQPVIAEKQFSFSKTLKLSQVFALLSI